MGKIAKRFKQLTDIGTLPFRGGSITHGEKASLPFLSFSMVQNMRGEHPGLYQRKGCALKHTTADGTLQTLSLYQFSKGKRTERHFFAQMSDGDVREATDAPPTVTTGTFGSSDIHDGAANQTPASWSNVDDLLIYSNGQDQHQIYAGTNNIIKKFVKFDGAAAPPDIPTEGYDYTQQVTDGLTTTAAILDSLNTYAQKECLFVCTPVPANRLTWTISLPNGTTSAVTVRYRKSDNTWQSVSGQGDTTAASGATLATTGGAMTWTHPTDEIPWYMYGTSGFWYRIDFSAQIDSEVEVTGLTYGSAFQDIVNVWDGVLRYAIEAQFLQDTGDPLETFGTDTIEIDSMVATNGRVYFSSPHKLIGFYADVGETPNTSASTTINAVNVWTGAGFTSVGTITDETNGLANSGFVTWGREGTAAEKTNFNASQYYAYWYYFTVDTTLSSNVIISIETMPYFDVDELGNSNASGVWKDKAVYSFKKDPHYLYVSKKDNPLVLNGDGFGLLEAGDGRSNKVNCIKPFHNEMMALQEEKGSEGGCVTLFEGDSTDPRTYGKLLLSSILGNMNAKSAVVVDGVLTSTATDEALKTLAFWISREGICVSDGRICAIISDDIRNYFDPKQTSTCIRRGYEKEHFVWHDKADNVLRFGLVCGTTATLPNVYPIFDLVDKVFYFDDYTQEFSCGVNVEAASGDIPLLQYCGGQADGFIYRVNTGTNDVTTGIDAYAQMEIGWKGLVLWLRRFLLRIKAQTAGNVTVTPSINTVAQTARNLSMTVVNTSEAVRRHLEGCNYQDQLISLKFQNSTASQELNLIDLGLELYEKVGH